MQQEEIWNAVLIPMNRNELQELLELLIVRAIEQIKHGQYDQALGTLEEVQYRLQQYVYGDR